MVFFRRTQSEDDPWLREKVWIFTAGAAVALVGMISDNSWVIGIGALILLSGILIRLLPRRGAEGQPDSDHEGHDMDSADPDRQGHDLDPADPDR